MFRNRRRLLKVLIVTMTAVLLAKLLLQQLPIGIVWTNLDGSEQVSDGKDAQIHQRIFDEDTAIRLQGRARESSKTEIQACRYPQLDPWDRDMMTYFEPTPPLDCKKDHLNWIEVINGRIVIVPRATEIHGKISCRLVPFKRKSDFDTEEGPEIDAENGTLIPTDFFRISCNSTSGKEYTNIHAGIHRDPNLLNKKNTVKTGLNLDILVLGFDSVSRMTFMRKLPKTYKYLLETLGAVVLKGYNIVGDGTPQALIPILTGKTELEMPRPLRRLNNGLHVDIFPFLWKNLSRKGYVTAWSEDLPSIGTFTYRITGFKEQPTDHYSRTMYNKVSSSKDRPLCTGDRDTVRVILDWFRDFMRDYRNSSKFGFMFHNALSHDGIKHLETGDTHLRDTLETMNKEGLLRNTMLFVMADHGSRFMKGTRIRTLQGKQEERNPFFSITLPEWFRKKYPVATKNLQLNSERLVTPFDIHETLADNLHFKGAGLGDKKNRGISIFQEIPLDRTCHDADVEAHWCNCLQWSELNISDKRALSAAAKVVKHINKQTDIKRDECVELSLAVIVRSAIFQTTKEMLAFLRTNDADGFRAELGDKMESTKELLQLTIRTSPNDGLYEATIEHNIQGGNYSVDETLYNCFWHKDGGCFRFPSCSD